MEDSLGPIRSRAARKAFSASGYGSRPLARPLSFWVRGFPAEMDLRWCMHSGSQLDAIKTEMRARY